jgi:hypothetical protein
VGGVGQQEVAKIVLEVFRRGMPRVRAGGDGRVRRDSSRAALGGVVDDTLVRTRYSTRLVMQ